MFQPSKSLCPQQSHLVSLALAFALMATSLSAATAADFQSISTVARVENVRGNAVITQVLQDKATPLTVGMELPEGALLKTGADGRVKLRFVDDSVMVVGDNSSLRVEKFTMANGKRSLAEIALDVGLISQKVAVGPKDSWMVKTPSVVTAVRGTEFIVEARPDTSTDVIIKSGNVWVNSLKKTRSIPTTLAEPNTAVACNAKGVCATDAETITNTDLKALEERLTLF